MSNCIRDKVDSKEFFFQPFKQNKVNEKINPPLPSNIRPPSLFLFPTYKLRKDIHRKNQVHFVHIYIVNLSIHNLLSLHHVGQTDGKIPSAVLFHRRLMKLSGHPLKTYCSMNYLNLCYFQPILH